MANLIGKNVLIVDEVDDTRTTLEYAVRELEKDVEAAVKKLGREGEKTNFSIFVLHNKDKSKKGQLPQEILHGRYIAARTVGDVWINYPWEATYVLFYLSSLPHSHSPFLRVHNSLSVQDAQYAFCLFFESC